MRSPTLKNWISRFACFRKCHGIFDLLIYLSINRFDLCIEIRIS